MQDNQERTAAPRDIILGACPPFHPGAPHLGLAYLDEYLNHHGFSSSVYDFSLEVYHRAPAEVRKLWDAPSWRQWQDEKFSERFCKEHEHLLGQCAKEMLTGSPRAVGLAVHMFSAIITLTLLPFIKKMMPGITVILGGPAFYTEERQGKPRVRVFGYPTYDHQPREEVLDGWLERADVIVLGEGEETLAEIVSRLSQGRDLDNIPGTARVRGGQHQVAPERPLIEDLDSVPFPTYRNFNLKLYKDNKLPLLTSRGCPNHCSFCVEHGRWRDSIRYRSPEHVLAEIEYNHRAHGTPFFKGADSLLNGKPDRLAAISEGIISRGISIEWGGSLMVHKEMDRAFFELCRRAGAHTFTFGVESASRRILRLMRKPLSIKIAERNLRDCHEAGIQTFVNILVGFPGETEEDFQETEAFLIRNRRVIDAANVVRSCIIYHSTEVATRHARYGLEYEVVEDLPGLYGVTQWADENGLDFEGREARRTRLLNLLVQQGIAMDGRAYPVGQEEWVRLVSDPKQWEWMGALLDAEVPEEYPLRFMIHLALEHPEPRVRASGLNLARFLRDDSFLPRIVASMDDPDEYVKEMAARALGTIGTADHTNLLLPLLQDWDNLSEGFKRDLRPLYEHYLRLFPPDSESPAQEPQ